MRTTINLACDKELRKLYQWSDKTRTPEELARITTTLQETYTGNYKVVERYRPDLQYWVQVCSLMTQWKKQCLS